MDIPAWNPVQLNLKTAGWLGIAGEAAWGTAAEGVVGVESVLSLPSKWC